jgi:hypothetical protein
LRTTLRRLPVSYRKSPKERVKALTQIIADADARKAARIGDKTVKRHFWALSRFFVFLGETGQLPADADNPGRGFTFNTKGSARMKRDMWSGEELAKLFASPIWTGCRAFFRSKVGDKVIRDARFCFRCLVCSTATAWRSSRNFGARVSVSAKASRIYVLPMKVTGN